MSASKVVFRRSKTGFEESDPDFWNDLAIVKAYDSAVSNKQEIMQQEDNDVDAQVSVTSSIGDSPQVGDVVWKRNPGVEVRNPGVEVRNPGDKVKSNSEGPKKKKKKTRTKNKKPTLWKVGDSCMAIYQEDQRYYPATVVAVNLASENIRVRYNDYDDEEAVVPLREVHLESMWTDAGINLYTVNRDDIFANKNDATKRSRADAENNSENFTPPSIPFMPPLDHVGPGMPNIKHLPGDGSDMTKEAMSSMLVSWYMAGYQTGYYRGLTSSSSK